jgi:hypothetical protein
VRSGATFPAKSYLLDWILNLTVRSTDAIESPFESQAFARLRIHLVFRGSSDGAVKAGGARRDGLPEPDVRLLFSVGRAPAIERLQGR